MAPTSKAKPWRRYSYPRSPIVFPYDICVFEGSTISVHILTREFTLVENYTEVQVKCAICGWVHSDSLVNQLRTTYTGLRRIGKELQTKLYLTCPEVDVRARESLPVNGPWGRFMLKLSKPLVNYLILPWALLGYREDVLSLISRLENPGWHPHIDSYLSNIDLKSYQYLLGEPVHYRMPCDVNTPAICGNTLYDLMDLSVWGPEETFVKDILKEVHDMSAKVLCKKLIDLCKEHEINELDLLMQLASRYG